MEIRKVLIEELIKVGGFWSYEPQSVRDSISDEQLIEATLEKLDLEQIDLLFNVFPFSKIKKVWLDTMVAQGDYYYNLNCFLAWYYFDIRYPDRYLKSMRTRRMAQLAKSTP